MNNFDGIENGGGWLGPFNIDRSKKKKATCFLSHFRNNKSSQEHIFINCQPVATSPAIKIPRYDLTHNRICFLVYIQYNLTLKWLQIPPQGLAALHASLVQVHGNLTSSKCLIDSRWVCKVADYGLHLLKSGQSSQDVGEHAKYKSKFWLVP